MEKLWTCVKNSGMGEGVLGEGGGGGGKHVTNNFINIASKGHKWQNGIS